MKRWSSSMMVCAAALLCASTSVFAEEPAPAKSTEPAAALSVHAPEAKGEAFTLPAPPDVDDAVKRDLAAQSLVPTSSDQPKEMPKSDEAKQAVIVPIEREQPASEPVLVLNLPDMPEVVASFANPDMGSAPSEAEVKSTADANPKADTLHERAKQIASGVVISPDEPSRAAEAVVDLAPPDLPTVVVSVEIPAPVAPAQSVAPAFAVEDAQIRAFIEPLKAKYRLRPALVDGFVAAYAARDGKPLWFEGEAVVAQAARLQAMLKAADEDGLDSSRLLSALPKQINGVIAADQRVDTELSLSFAAWLYAHDARGGRLEPSRLSNLLTPNLALPQPVEVMAAMGVRGLDQLPDFLASYQPPHAGYRALKAQLAKLKAEQADPATTASTPDARQSLPANFVGQAPLVAGKEDARVPSLRIRLGLPAADNTMFDAALVDAIKEFQRVNELTANGRITPRTREALENLRNPANMAEKKQDKSGLQAALLANMERWRWLPPELGATHIFVNVPDYKLQMVADGAVIHQTRVIVGKPETQTPVFSDQMDHLIVNPSWHVPPSILKKEFIPRLAQDPEYASKRGYEVVRRGNTISVRQPPGARNALGHIKFMFPNQHSVYLHDTPTRHLFQNASRAFSHGCVRVEGPFQLAEQLLLKRQGFTEKQLRAMVGGGERMIKLNEKVPVHLAYFTLFVDANGALEMRPDLYGHDARLRKALSL